MSPDSHLVDETCLAYYLAHLMRECEISYPLDHETWTWGWAMRIAFYYQLRNSEIKKLSPNSGTNIKSIEVLGHPSSMRDGEQETQEILRWNFVSLSRGL